MNSKLNYKGQMDMLIQSNQMKSPDQNNTVRFAMMYDAKCLNPECPSPSVGTGVRFNARKSVVGKYLESIKIYEFRMKCPNCDNQFVIRTDPKGCDYVFVSGVKKLFSEYLQSKKQVKAEMGVREAARAQMTLDEKVRSVGE